MIVGHGIDLQDISAIEKVYLRNARFARKVLTDKELALFKQFSHHRKMTYLAGRWAGKEAFSKAMGTGIGQLTFQDIEIINDSKGRPIITKSPFQGKAFISISHSGGYVQASVILEDLA
ncbi:holo-ACP synthase [Streptococcus equi]|uniref:holo-ACP synthase n=1 Tax=Streptococcus equi TaxID=1336 RepID=UPI001BB54E66|nr:holo-ACP synthase [Streptococcus equi]MCD3384805.1 holo-ACP synthase [Streptococcus equi subsp. zooepidemicus]MCD3393183.1 holo-ACP synthase [Streptococcus equi subsp. zooepidemicus]QTR95208.1 Holo-[acyl-carrier-protein] synthase [Streptococcus equi subsp. zooepidemicus]HEL0698625.1 holo-ACP synthase [Streptococcus equi subsp. zooepidemicus]HEL0746546.1 holo-ACP synthase [Streptococcus equi subsp. zooepidemicus]